MARRDPDYEVKPFPLSRRVIIDSGRAARRRHTILGLLEVDVTEARRIIRSVNKGSFRSIHEEIRAVKANPQGSGSLQNQRLFAAFLLLPGFVHDLFYRILGRSPRLFKQQVGTVFVSAVGMYGSGGAWGLGAGSIYTTSILLGGIAQKPGVVDGQIAVREYLSLTVDFDHDIVDGAPAARFADRFKELIEAADGLGEP